VRDEQQIPLWKVRTASLLDNEIDFNELYQMFDAFQLFDFNLQPKKLCKFFIEVTGQVRAPDPTAAIPLRF
jgi:hypothetical protein